jgi:HicB family
MLNVKCKRIIDGKTYNTETATQIIGWRRSDDNLPFDESFALFQTRFGAFFLYSYRDFDDPPEWEQIHPMTPEAAQAWLEKNAPWRPELIEQLFGEMPEAGASEVKYTLRMPESLRDRLAALAKANKQSLNAWIIRCLEGCANATATNSTSGKPETSR